MATKPLNTIKFPTLPDTYTVPQVDATLTQSGKAADAKKTGDEINALKEDINEINGEQTETNYSAPGLVAITAANYPSFTQQNTMYISNRVIPAGAVITSIDIQSLTTGTIVLINNDNEVVYTQATTTSGDSLKNHVINYTPNEDVRFGFVGFRMRFGSQSNFDDVCISTDGLYESSNTSPTVGDTLTITKTATTPFRFCCQWHYTAYRVLLSRAEITDEISSINTYIGIQKTHNLLLNDWQPIGLQFNNNMPKYYDISGSVGFVGRWYDMDVDGVACKVTNNCGSELYFKVKGTTSVSVTWKAMTQTNAYFAYSIDGGSLTRQLISNGTITLSNTDEHIIRIITDGITENIGKWTNGTGFAFADVNVGSGSITGVLPQNPMIMFLGDSIVEGIRALGIDDTDMGNTNSATGAFPWFCCEKLNAISYRVGYGASGLTANGSFHKAIDALKYYYNGVPIDVVYPNAILIEYGENDGSASSADFINAYNTLLDAIKVMYPGIRAYLMIPLSQTHASDIRTVAQNHEWCTLVETADWSGITYADGTHPLSAGAEVAGNYLADFIKNDVYGIS